MTDLASLEEKLTTVNYWIKVLCDIFLTFISIFILVLVCKVHKRSDLFLISIPILFFVYGLFCAPYDFSALAGLETKKWEVTMIPIANFCYFMAHWLFPS